MLPGQGCTAWTAQPQLPAGLSMLPVGMGMAELADNMGNHIPGQAVGGEGINHCLLVYPWLMGGGKGILSGPSCPSTCPHCICLL